MSPKKKKSGGPNIAVYVLANGFVLAAGLFAWKSGYFTRNRAKDESVVLMTQAEEIVVHEQLNGLIREANRLIQSRDYRAATPKLDLARSIAERSKSESVRKRVSEIDRAIALLSQRLTSPVRAKPKPGAATDPFANAGAIEPMPQDPPPTTPADSPVENPTPTAGEPVVDPSAWLSSTNPEQICLAGWLALQRSDPLTAEKLFKRSLQMRSDHGDSRYGMLLVRLGREAITTSEDFDKLLSRKADDRTVIVNAAAANLSRNPVRSAKILSDGLVRQKPVDELLLNYLGTCLARADAQGTRSPGIERMERIYLDCEAELERSRADGQRRWGSVWCSEPEARLKWTAYRAARAKTQTARDDLAKGQRAFEVMQRQYADAKGSAAAVPGLGRDLSRPVDPAAFDDAVRKARDYIAAAQKSLDEAERELAGTESPQWPATIDVLLPDRAPPAAQ